MERDLLEHVDEEDLQLLPRTELMVSKLSK